MASFDVLLLPGDGIGPEVMAETKKVMSWLAKQKKGVFNTPFFALRVGRANRRTRPCPCGAARTDWFRPHPVSLESRMFGEAC